MGILDTLILQIQSLKSPQKNNKKNSLSFFHINACSSNKIFDDVVYLLKRTKKNFDIIAISETRIQENVNLKNYSFESTPTESTVGGIMLYISSLLSCKLRIDFNVYKNVN